MSTDIQKPQTQIAVRSPLSIMAERLGAVADPLFFNSLRLVAFNSPNATKEQLLALCVVANQYKLNPFTRELYAFPAKGGGIVPIVSVDGWYRITNEHEQYDGCELEFADELVDCGSKKIPAWCQVTMYRRDRSRPRVHREYFDEVFRSTDPWKTHPRRMLEHKAFIQTARACFGFAGIYEPDEAERIIEAKATRVEYTSGTERLAALLTDPTPEPADAGPTADDLNGNVEHTETETPSATTK